MESSIWVQSKSLLCHSKKTVWSSSFYNNSDVKPLCRTNVLLVKHVRLHYVQWSLKCFTTQMFLYYLVSIWKTKQSLLKKTLSRPAELAYLRVFIWKIFISPRWDLGKIKWDLTWAGWFASHMNGIYFYKSFFKEGEISPSRASPHNRISSPPYEQPLRRMLCGTWLIWQCYIYSNI